MRNVSQHLKVNGSCVDSETACVESLKSGGSLLVLSSWKDDSIAQRHRQLAQKQISTKR